jgi:ribosomal-protein-alanine N-acetyltransferase
VIIVRTERAVVRPFADSDLDRFAAITGDLDLMRYVDTGAGLTRDETAYWIEVTRRNHAKDGWTTWAVADPDTDEVFGYAGLIHGTEPDTIEITYVLMRERWGRGLAGEIVTALSRYALDDRGLDAVYATIHPDNVASRRVVEKAGFVAVRERIDKDGNPDILYRLAAESRAEQGT